MILATNSMIWFAFYFPGQFFGRDFQRFLESWNTLAQREFCKQICFGHLAYERVGKVLKLKIHLILLYTTFLKCIWPHNSAWKNAFWKISAYVAFSLPGKVVIPFTIWSSRPFRNPPTHLTMWLLFCVLGWMILYLQLYFIWKGKKRV